MSQSESERERKALYRREQRAAAMDIGPPPITAAQKRKGATLRKKIRADLLAFNQKMFPESTGLKPFGRVQIDSIAQDQAVITKGGKITKAEPRGYGKTTRSANAGLWAALEGYRSMIPVFASSLQNAKKIIQRWKTEILTNELLLWAYPDLIWPLRALGGSSQRAATQTYKGEPTGVVWSTDTIVFPSCGKEPGRGAVLMALPLVSCRGVQYTRADGKILRPDLVIFDDVQRDRDAANPATIDSLEELISRSAMMLGGHSKSLSAIMNCTVRKEDDLSERFLRKPGWRRSRYKMLVKPADAHETLWLREYAEILLGFDATQPDDDERAARDALKYYKKHRKAMDAGAEVSWEWAYTWEEDEPTEISAIQHAYNILIREGPDVFASECQNEPIKPRTDITLLTAREVATKTSGHKRGEIPAPCQRLTSMIDVQGSLLYWGIMGWVDDFSGYVIDYGSFPDQGEKYFRLLNTRNTLQRAYPGYTDEAAIYAGLQKLFEALFGHEWIRTDGAHLPISRGLVDANWGETSETVCLACWGSQYRGILTPSYGRGIKATQKPISQWQQSIGKQCGPEWVPTKASSKKSVLGVVYDANYWKTRLHNALALPTGSPGAITLFDATEAEHKMLGDHVTAELPTRVAANGRTAVEWSLIPNREEHLLDVLVGCMVGASMCGVSTMFARPAAAARRKRRRMRQH